MSSACARHILVGSEEECLKLKSEIEAGTDFAESAKKFSKSYEIPQNQSKSIEIHI